MATRRQVCDGVRRQKIRWGIPCIEANWRVSSSIARLMTYGRRPLFGVAHSACQSVDCRRVKGEVRCAGGPKRATAHRSAGGDTRKPGPSRHRNRRHGCRGCATRSPGSNQGQTNPHVVGHASADWSALLSRMDQVQAFRISSDGYGVALAHDSRIEPCALFDGHDARQADWQYALNQDLTVSCDIECSGHAR